MTNPIRERVKQQMPTVLLTLTSIVQALALELAWSHVRENGELVGLSLEIAIHWVQIVATFVGIALIWIIYANNVMRFVWVPTTKDSVFPFVIGLMEFMLIESLGTARLGWWMIDLALLFALMTWVAHLTMQSARLDAENDWYFRTRASAGASDFYPAIAIVVGLTLAGAYLLVGETVAIPALLMTVAALIAIVWQLAAATRFWRASVVDTTD